VAPPATDSVFFDSSWISSSIAARVEPAGVAPGETGTFTVRLQAPTVRAPIDYTLRWALREVGGPVYDSPGPDALTTRITVAPCNESTPDSGAELDGAVGPRMDPGCSCRTSGSAGGSHGVGRAVAALAFALAVAVRSRSRSIDLSRLASC
jgi:MYXO-CTERM domain-containing protein